MSDNTSSSDSEDNCNIIINRLIDKAKSNKIPENSKKVYEVQYEKFQRWRQEMKTNGADEMILLGYFEKLSENYKATSLWATYTKLKAMLSFKENIDISRYMELQSFLKRKEKHHKVKKSKVFTHEEVSTFINNAPDDEFLLHKVILIMGLHGCLRKVELLNMNIDDIKLDGSIYHVSIPVTKTGVSKSFVTSEEVYPIIEKYMKLRPEGMTRFFLQYRNQKCTHQNVGKGKIASIPQDIAKFLNLPEPRMYTGHAFRRTSAALLADKGADLLTLKRHGAWKSSNVPRSYINESMQNKQDISKLISSSINIKPSTSKQKEMKLTKAETKETENITQEDLQKVVTTEYVLPNKKQKKEITNVEKQSTENIKIITQEELQEIITTDCLGNKIKENQPIYIFKNCNVTVNQS